MRRSAWVAGITTAILAASADAALPSQTVCVAPGGAGACFASVGAALAAAAPGHTVRVAAGTYVENVVIDENVTLEGGWNPSFTERDPSTQETILEPSDPTFSVVDIEGDGANPAASVPVLDGFTIRGGRADLGGNHGGGIRIRDSHATVRNCVVAGNRASLFGGGVWVQRGAPRFERNRIEGNVVVGDGALGGGIQLETSSTGVVLSGNEIVGNSVEGVGGYGGGVQSFDAFVQVRGGRFENNRAATTCASGRGGAIDAPGVDVRSATFRGNCAAEADAIRATFAQIQGSLFVSGPNDATPAQLVIESETGSAKVQNSTFVWTGPTPVAGIEIRDAEANGADGFQFDNDVFVAVEIAEVDLARAYGERNVFLNGAVNGSAYLEALPVADPGLDAEYRLLPGSPLIDAGVSGDHHRDVDGDARPADGGSGAFAFDVGADEFQGRPQRIWDLALDDADLTIAGPGNPPENPDSIGTNDWIGRAVLARDVSGDGLDDLVVSAQDFANDFDTNNAGGRLFGLLHFGARRSGVLDLASEPADFAVTCAVPLQHLGEELAAGDLDDDGTLDLVAGASDTHGDPGVRPKAIALFGGADLLDGAAITPASLGDFAAIAAEPSSLAFASVDALATGDLSGDGIDDLVVGDASADAPGLDDAGAVYLFRGGASFGGARDLAAVTADVTIFGNGGDGTFAAGGYAGGVAVGDLDGDGNLDLVARDGDSAHVLFGPIAPGRTLTVSPSTRVEPIEIGNVLVMDLTADGRDDLLLDSAGTIHVFAGPLARNVVLAPAQASHALVHDDVFPAQALTAADVTGDPQPDLLVADPIDRIVYVVSPDATRTGTLAIEDAAVWIVHASSAAVAGLGFDADGGDLDGDGRADLVVGSWGINDAVRAQGFRDVGKAFVFYGDACGNGSLQAGESCDDADVAHGDGCAGWCAVETDYACVGAPSACGLDVTRLAPSAVTGTSAASLGEVVGVQANVTSSLELAHDGVELVFWLSLDGVLGAGDRQVGACALPPIDPSETESCDDSLVIPVDLALPGGAQTTYRWLGCVETESGVRCAAGNTIAVPEPGALASALVALLALQRRRRVGVSTGAFTDVGRRSSSSSSVFGQSSRSSRESARSASSLPSV